ncbi:nitroreductase family protein [Mycobacterium sp.]|uniref:nitroreductase family protein n=1 Tax=Mycobacterium sp. TaxID=1785 RepID=UPI002D138C76|nr:nitroreductase family protein [Mycobacterium sp.]HTY29982.1 nitroreductase family protein [Mycobacterium sp.]
MNDLLNLIEKRQSLRVPFDGGRPISARDLLQVLEAARWSPTAHNMQNFEIVVVDDQKVLDEIGAIPVQLSEEFLREHLQLLSFSEEELRRKEVGLFAGALPAWMGDLARMGKGGEAIPLHRLMPDCPVLLIVLYDTTRRAPASEGDVLGMMSLGCVLQNMWLMAQSLGLGFQVLSVLSNPTVEEAVKQLLAVPGELKVAFAVRLGHPVVSLPYLRVRRDVAEFVHRNHWESR